MEERTINISVEEFKHFLKCEMKVNSLVEHVTTSNFISDSFVRSILEIKEKENATD